MHIDINGKINEITYTACGGAYPAQDYRYPKVGGNGWVYIEYGGDI